MSSSIEEIKKTGKFTWGKPISWHEIGPYTLLEYHTNNCDPFVDGKYTEEVLFHGWFDGKEADHRDRDRANNRWNNLREASRSCNMRNCGILCNNKSGVTGVSWHKSSSNWRSQIKLHGKMIHLGGFKNFLDAVKARWDAEVKYGFPNCCTTSSAYLHLTKNDFMPLVA
jgi:hypothetical protein